jgi:hypothetical protein
VLRGAHDVALMSIQVVFRAVNFSSP